MASEVSITQIGYGSLDPGIGCEVYCWTLTESDYNQQRKRASFFTAVPDPWIPFGNPPGSAGTLEIEGISQIEITRVWNLVRTTVDPNFKDHHVFQNNVAMVNSGLQTTGWELLRGETDNG